MARERIETLRDGQTALERFALDEFVDPAIRMKPAELHEPRVDEHVPADSSGRRELRELIETSHEEALRIPRIEVVALELQPIRARSGPDGLAQREIAGPELAQEVGTRRGESLQLAHAVRTAAVVDVTRPLDVVGGEAVDQQVRAIGRDCPPQPRHRVFDVGAADPDVDDLVTRTAALLVHEVLENGGIRVPRCRGSARSRNSATPDPIVPNRL